MTARDEIREFLVSRRARVMPEQVGLVSTGHRRVPGLRREEVAILAGVSATYYTRLERGDATGVSDGVLNALAGALRLDDAERSHLFDIVRAAHPGAAAAPRRRPRAAGLAPDVQQILDAVTGGAALLRNERLDVLGANPLGRALYSLVLESPVRPANTIRFCFLDPRARDFYADWPSAANDSVAVLRSAIGRDPHDRVTSDLVGELSTHSDEFRTRWAAHDVRFHLSGAKRFHHPVVGDIRLNFNRLALGADPSLTIFVYTATPHTRDAETLALLGSWAAEPPPSALSRDGSEH